ncbi:hypothetical protein [Mycoplasma capricolum]|uniref:hypothetical protein n=1 Tax=Mycoplasma capricolum TaxID=2095 RepID=UPI0034DB66E8
MKLIQQLKNFFNKIKSFFKKKNSAIVYNKHKAIENKKKLNSSDQIDNSSINISNNQEYIDKRAVLDSQNEFKLKVILNKTQVLEQLTQIKNTFKECEDCQNIYRLKIDDMKIKISQLKRYIDHNYGFLGNEKEYREYVFLDNIKSYSQTDDKAGLDLISELENYFNKYLNYDVNYFVPCDKHKNLIDEYKILSIKVDDLDKIISK